MTAPKRVQRTRLKGGGMPAGSVLVARPTIYGNPYLVVKVPELTCRVGPGVRSQWRNGTHWHTVWPDGQTWCFETRALAAERAVELHRLHTGPMGNYEIEDADLEWLRGKDLACWCPLDLPCHADTLLEFANTPQETP